MTAPVVSLMQRDITTERDLLISVFSTQDRQKPVLLSPLAKKVEGKKERKKEEEEEEEEDQPTYIIIRNTSYKVLFSNQSYCTALYKQLMTKTIVT